jgi:hypothetical protein
MTARVLLLQLDGKQPNIALMRVAAHHRTLGHSVELRKAGNSATVERQLWDQHDTVYLVSFSDGRIKVGMSWDPKTRVQQHAMDARRTGLSAVGSWFSPGIDDPALIEKRVLARIERNGGIRVGLTREYFTGIDFARAVVLAEATCGATS